MHVCFKCGGRLTFNQRSFVEMTISEMTFGQMAFGEMRWNHREVEIFFQPTKTRSSVQNENGQKRNFLKGWCQE